MKVNNPGLKIDVFRDGSLLGSFEEKKGRQSDFTCSASSSIYDFPSVSFKSSSGEFGKLFMDFSNNDVVKLSTSGQGGSDFHMFFEGEYFGKKISFVADGNELSVDVKAVHSFVGMTLLSIEGEFVFDGFTFESAVLSLCELAKISSKVTFNNGIGDVVLCGFTTGTNIFRVLKELCSLVDAVVVFGSDNTAVFDVREEVVKRIQGGVPTVITDEDIVSFDSQDGM